jgi:hypothetical protein
MGRIVFRPWVGSLYGRTDSRLLMVGESHYGEPDEHPTEATTTVVEKWRAGEWNLRYLTTAACLLTGLPSWQIDRRAALENIAFYNFVQISMPFIEMRPTEAQVRASWDAFREVLDVLSPTHILATGQKLLWENMPPFDRGESRFCVGDKDMEVGEYATPNGFALASVIPHLSRYFSAPKWRSAVQAFLALDKLPPQ